MKFTTKILSIVLVLCMLLTSFGYAATYTDVTKENANYSAISLLSSLGIIKGYEENGTYTFKPENNVTRAEFTVMLMRTLNLSNLGSNDPAGTPFTDIDVVKDWAVSDIRTAYDLGIIKGMDEHTFAPNDNVTNEQALKMIVCAMGYEPMAIEVAGGADKVWPTGYTTVANQLTLTTGVTSLLDAPAKRGEIAKYIYNALEVDLMKTTEYPNGAVRNEIITGMNILNDKLKVFKANGELLADSETSALESGSLARAGEVVILPEYDSDYKTFKIADFSTKGLVGRSIEFYYDEDINGVKTILHINDYTKDSNVINLDPEKIDGVDVEWDEGGEITYWESDDDRKPTSIRIAAYPVLSINGRVVDLDNADDPDDVFMIDSGSIELIDANNTGVFNKINIVSYETYVVNSVSASTKTVVDYYTSSKNIILDEEDPKVTLSMTRSTNGSTVAFSSLKKYDVISVKTRVGSNNRTTIEVIVSSEKVNGTINAISLSDKALEIDNKEYKVSNYLINCGLEKLKQLQINDTCTFYLDKDGKIAAFDKAASASAAYTYICGVAYEESTLTFKVIDNAGSKKTLYGASKVKIDGKSVQDEDVPETLMGIIEDEGGNIDGKTENGSQLVKLTKNTSNQVTAIDTIYELDSDGDGNVKLSKSSEEKYTYKASNKSFTNETGDSFMIDSSTIIFIVPADRTNYDKYYKRTLSYFKDEDEIKNFEVYNLGTGSASKAKCLVIYGSQSKSDDISERSPLLIVDKVTPSISSTGTYINEISGYLFGDGEANDGQYITINSTKENLLSDAEVGEVYSILKSSSKSFTKAKLTSTFLGVSSNASYYKEFGDKVKYTFVRGLLDDVDGSTFVIADTTDVDDLINEEDVEKTYFEITDSTVVITLKEGTKHDYVIGFGETDLATFTKFTDFIDKDGNIAENALADDVFLYIVDDEIIFIYRII